VYRVRTSQYCSVAKRRVLAAYSQSALPTGGRLDDVIVVVVEYKRVFVVLLFSALTLLVGSFDP